MKNLIRKILREYEEKKILVIPSLTYFNDNWDLLQLFLKSKGNPKWKINGDLDLNGLEIKSLGNLISVGGNLELFGTSIESLGNLRYVGGYLDLYDTPIKSLGNLTSVGDFLNLTDSSIKSLGKLQRVGGYLDLINSPLSEKYTEEEIRQMVKVEGDIYI